VSGSGDGDVRHVSVGEAAGLLGLSERGVRDRIQRGQLHAVRDGRAWVVAVPAVLADAPNGSAPADAVALPHQPNGTAAATAAPNGSAPAPAAGAATLARVEQAVAGLWAELAALREENARLRVEVTAKAEAAGLWQGGALTLEAQVRLLTAGQ
jgi:hypothetical protein